MGCPLPILLSSARGRRNQLQRDPRNKLRRKTLSQKHDASPKSQPSALCPCLSRLEVRNGARLPNESLRTSGHPPPPSRADPSGRPQPICRISALRPPAYVRTRRMFDMWGSEPNEQGNVAALASAKVRGVLDLHLAGWRQCKGAAPSFRRARMEGATCACMPVEARHTPAASCVFCFVLHRTSRAGLYRHVRVRIAIRSTSNYRCTPLMASRAAEHRYNTETTLEWICPIT